MANYKITEAAGSYFVIMDSTDNQYDTKVYFAGYDAMGSVIWEKRFSFDYALSGREEAEQIIKDLKAADEPAEPEAKKDDHQIKAIQIALDVARCRRNDAYDAYANYQKNDRFDIGGLDKAYRNYEKEQAFYEGCIFAIFAAGYSIQTQVGTDECIVTK